MIYGIDPGTHTGLALWDSLAGRFLELEALPVHRALERVAERLRAYPFTPVVFEDARLRTWFGGMDREQRKYGNAVREGAGAAKRDATIWADFLEDKGAPCFPRKPSSGSTKWPADRFARVTGWTGRTNEHARDAGVLVFGLKVHEVATMCRSWQQARANSATRTQARG